MVKGRREKPASARRCITYTNDRDSRFTDSLPVDAFFNKNETKPLIMLSFIFRYIFTCKLIIIYIYINVKRNVQSDI